MNKVILQLATNFRPRTSLIVVGIAARPSATGDTHGFTSSSARGAKLRFVTGFDSPFHKSLPHRISRALSVFVCVAEPGFLASQDFPENGRLQGTVQVQMRNVIFRFSETVAVEIKSLNGVLVPLGKNEFPVFNDKDSFNVRISTAEIAIDSSNLAIVLNSYFLRVRIRPSPNFPSALRRGA